jgi:Skp family chaperone for outer membrane proteins
MILFIILFLFILILFFSLKLKNREKIKKEHFFNILQDIEKSGSKTIQTLKDLPQKKSQEPEKDTIPSEIGCVNINEKCMVNQDGISNCCDGHYCIQKKGNFEYKVCSSEKPEKYKNKFNDFIMNSANKLSKAEKDIIKKYEELTEEEQFVLELKDYCSSSNKLSIPNIFYKNNKISKECDCSEYNDNKDNDDDKFNLFSDINFKNCKIFPT